MVPVPIAGANCENEGPKAPEWLILVPGRAGVCGGVGCNPGRRGVRGTPATSSAVATLCCYAVVATLWLLHCGCYAVGDTLWLRLIVEGQGEALRISDTGDNLRQRDT